MFSSTRQPAPHRRKGFTAENQPPRERLVRGEGHHSSKVDDETVRLIREDCEEGDRLRELLKCYTLEAIANRYGLSKSQVHDIKQYRSWIHVE